MHNKSRGEELFTLCRVGPPSVLRVAGVGEHGVCTDPYAVPQQAVSRPQRGPVRLAQSPSNLQPRGHGARGGITARR